MIRINILSNTLFANNKIDQYHKNTNLNLILVYNKIYLNCFYGLIAEYNKFFSKSQFISDPYILPLVIYTLPFQYLSHKY